MRGEEVARTRDVRCAYRSGGILAGPFTGPPPPLALPRRLTTIALALRLGDPLLGAGMAVALTDVPTDSDLSDRSVPAEKRRAWGSGRASRVQIKFHSS